MKAPKGITTLISSNSHIANEKSHIVNSLNYEKLQVVKINATLYKKIESIADERNVVLSDIARIALKFYLDNPDTAYSESLSKGNEIKLIYNINQLYDMKIEKFKSDYGVNRSDQIRRALSAWLNHEGY